MLLRRSRSVSWEIAREVHPNLEPNAYGLLLWLRRSGPIRLTDLAALLGRQQGHAEPADCAAWRRWAWCGASPTRPTDGPPAGA